MTAFEEFIETTRRRLELELPGSQAQARMAPSHRARLSTDRSGAREGSVMVLLFPADGGVSTLFTVRQPDLSDHAGQISFPGGRREPHETFEETALRECEEEVGIQRSGVAVLGPLSTLYIPPTRFVVHPFVGVISSLPDLTLQEREVSAVLRVPIRQLQDPATQESEEWTLRGERSTVPFFRVDGHVIWGATAMITAELLDVLDGVPSI